MTIIEAASMLTAKHRGQIIDEKHGQIGMFRVLDNKNGEPEISVATVSKIGEGKLSYNNYWLTEIQEHIQGFSMPPID